jgi:uncharacterized membrane protein YhaH (DUF805 family)
MNFTDAISTVLRRSFTMAERSGRAEYWWWQLFSALVAGIVPEIVAAAAGRSAGDVVGGLVFLAIVVPSFTVSWRRMHDVGRAGMWMFFPIVNFVFALLPSRPEANRWGPPPPPRN